METKINLIEFVDSLSHKEYMELKEIIKSREASNDKRLSINEFIEINKHDMSVKLISILEKASKEYTYVEQLQLADLYRYKGVGLKTLTELEAYMVYNNISIKYYKSGRLKYGPKDK